ncbi:hypothetical protein KPP2020_044 [Klebsiella phage KPP2020]|uniref:Uncharacterized protein n=1 Tax=Klebsiella phage KPP2020 TaxID=3017288 RepID=A0AAE9YK52_9CAUD|nr:hypothetical protein KPP2020_044 [Klebsiella phage KPP2020]
MHLDGIEYAADKVALTFAGSIDNHKFDGVH